MPRLTIALAQFDFPVGAVRENAARIAELAAKARDAGAQLALFPELALSGYLAEDLFLRPGFLRACEQARLDLVQRLHGIDVLFGHPLEEHGTLHNALTWVRDGRALGVYRKQELPNYTVFDEKRYFAPGRETLVLDCGGVRLGALICEDLWEPGPAASACAAGAEALLVINASPYDPRNRAERIELARVRARTHGVPVVYVNLVCGQDDLVFDGGAMAVGAGGELVGPAPAFHDDLYLVELDSSGASVKARGWQAAEEPEIERRYRALVRAIRDYVGKNGFPGVLLGLSGGIDSALTLALAVDALGAERVTAVMMPSRYTSELSLEQARAQATALGVRYHEIPIEQPFQAFADLLAPAFAGRAADLTEENMQARCRGVILMALSNKFGHMVLATGNKSEMAVGYATIYGDMCGGFAPLRDCYKTVVYELCRWRNARSPAIPEAVIARPPSAELREHQTDQDSLPPYDLLDRMLERYLEDDASRDELVAEGYAPDTVDRVISLVLRSEYKRRQGAPGPRITRRALGRDRRYPISSAWRGGAR